MTALQTRRNSSSLFDRTSLIVTCAALALTGWTASSIQAATTWDSYTLDTMGGPLGHATSSYFDPINWSTANLGTAAPWALPPNNGSGAATDILINALTAPSTEVVYDPSEDNPDFQAISDTPANYQAFPTGYGLQTVWRIYLGREAVGVNNTGLAKLTIMGDMQTDKTAGDTRWQIGRNSGTAGTAANGMIVQENGVVKNLYGDLDLGSNDSGLIGAFGNGTYEYKKGTFEQGVDNDNLTTLRLRLSAGGSTSVGGTGTFIVHNPGVATGGYVRAQDFQVAPFGGQNGFEPNGSTNGMGLVEFHATSEGTRAIQVVNSLYLGNGADSFVVPGDTGIRSSRLRLTLDEAPALLGGGVPIDLPLFDVDSDRDSAGVITGPGTTGNSFGYTFSNADAVNPLDISAVYESGDIVTAMFGESTYRWNIYYNGDIRWSDANNSILDTSFYGDGIGGVGTGKDIVLIGLDSIVVETGLPGDFNDDDVVDAADYTVWRNNYGTNFDLNGNGNETGGSAGTVDDEDYLWWRRYYGTSSGPGGGGFAGNSVPEPSSVLLSLLAMAGVCGFGRRGRAAA